MPSSEDAPVVPASPPCTCTAPGWCERFDRAMTPYEHSICSGVHGTATIRNIFVREWRESADVRRARRAGTMPPSARDDRALTQAAMTCPHRTLPEGCGCVKCGPGGTYPGTKVSLDVCLACRAKAIAPPALGPIGDGYHMVDHAGLTFAAGATAPRFYDANDWPFSLAGHAGQVGVLLGGGPSLLSTDWKDLDLAPDRVTLSVNSVAKVATTDLWVCVDDPDTVPAAARFDRETWLSPGVRKFVPRGLAGSRIDGRAGSGPLVRDCPSVAFFLRRTGFDPATFLSERAFCWGDEPNTSGLGRSVLLAALKVFFVLGVRTVILLGCDFHMDANRPYAHDERKADNAVASNNAKFAALNDALTRLRPHLDQAGLTVLNATPGSRLTAFEHVSLADALTRRRK